MEGNRRTVAMIGIAVSIGVLYFVTTQMMKGNEEAAGTTEAAAGAAESPSDDGADSADSDSESGSGQHLSRDERMALRETATITTDDYTATIDNLGGGIARFEITGDPRFTTEEGAPIDVVSTNTAEFPEYDSMRTALGGDVEIPDDAVWELSQTSPRSVRLVWRNDDVEVERILSAGTGPYQVWMVTKIRNRGAAPLETRLELNAWHYVRRDDESGGIVASRSPYISNAVCVYGEETERKDRDKLVDDGISIAHGYGNNDVHVSAVENVYFVQAMAAAGETRAGRCAMFGEDRFAPNVADADGTLFRSMMAYPRVEIAPGGEQVYQTLAYLGPKDPSALNTAGHRLPEMVDLGFFSLIARQLARLLSFMHQYIPNWGLAIILLTLMIRLTLFPLTNLSFKSMARMRQLKPEIDRINELYKDDAEKKGAAVMELYRKNKVNPLSGCLPSVVQLPVWWALYTSLSTNIELYHMPFALWWSDLSSPDPYYVLPVMLGALMHLQQRLNPSMGTMDATQAKMMMWFMPIMITVFMLFLPSGLCLYMLTNSALGIAQMKLNEYRLAKEADGAVESVVDDDGDDDDGFDGDSEEDAGSEKPQRRRPRRKRRVRRGRA
ncbi:MAG: membrane protein insertase YidC [Sandaracinaceae bacterium]